MNSNKKATLGLDIDYEPFAWMVSKPEARKIEDDESLLHGPLKMADGNKNTYFLSRFGHYYNGPSIELQDYVRVDLTFPKVEVINFIAVEWKFR